MYVWYDALANYITALDLENNGANFQKYWTNGTRRIHMIGKGINRFHSIYWPAMLMSAGIELPTEVFVHGYLTINGQKISKSLGYVVDPVLQVEKFGTDAIRYYLLRAVSPFEDGDYGDERFKEVYNADLASNLGNLARRVETIGAKAGHVPKPVDIQDAPEGYHAAMEEYRFHDALATLWRVASDLNTRIEEVKPWALAKEDKHDEVADFLDELIVGLRQIAHYLTPFLPQTAENLSTIFKADVPMEKGEALFPRLQ